MPRKIAQQCYNERAKRLITGRISQMRRILKDYSDTKIDDLYEREHPARRELIEPVEKIWSQRLEEWKNTKYEGKEFQEGMPIITTEKGERVRSKSEKILADYFYHKGIEYKYEKPLQLKAGKEFYWEHFGRLDDPIYAKVTVKKMETYVRNSVLPEIDLPATYETVEQPLRMDCVEIVVSSYLQ